MELDRTDHELIDRYLKGELEGEELRAFEGRVGSDAAFAKQVEERKDALSVLAAAGREALRERFRALHREMEDEQTNDHEDEEQTNDQHTTNNPGRGRIWWALAAVILLLIVPTLLYFSGSNPAPQELYASYFQPGKDRNFDVGRSVANAQYAQGIEAFNANDFTNALPNFQDLSNQYPDSLIFQLFSGACHLGLTQPTQARQALTPIAEQPGNNYHPAANWYIGLSHLQEDEPEKARPYFEKLENKESIYTEQARELLDKLD